MHGWRQSRRNHFSAVNFLPLTAISAANSAISVVETLKMNYDFVMGPGAPSSPDSGSLL